MLSRTGYNESILTDCQFVLYDISQWEADARRKETSNHLIREVDVLDQSAGGTQDLRENSECSLAVFTLKIPIDAERDPPE